MTTGEKLRALRIEEGITVAELADRLRITENYIQQVEAGAIVPARLMIGYLADALGVHRSELDASG